MNALLLIYMVHLSLKSNNSVSDDDYQDGSADPTFSGASNSYSIEPLPGLETVLDELRQEEGYDLHLLLRNGIHNIFLHCELENMERFIRQLLILFFVGRVSYHNNMMCIYFPQAILSIDSTQICHV